MVVISLLPRGSERELPRRRNQKTALSLKLKSLRVKDIEGGFLLFNA